MKQGKGNEKFTSEGLREEEIRPRIERAGGPEPGEGG